MMEKTFFLKRWPTVRENLLLILDAFEESDLAFLPVEGGWTVGRIMLHISSAANYWLHSGILSPVTIYQPGQAVLENYPTLDAIRDFLAEEHNRTITLLENFDGEDLQKAYTYPDSCSYKPSWIFWHVLEHEIHHRGELSLILGLLGRSGLEL
jgi:uncharacterized damage-inducible protein DinB